MRLPATFIFSLSACGDAIHIGDDTGKPLAVLEAQVEGEAPEQLQQELLRAALLWSRAPTCSGRTCNPLAALGTVGSSHTLEIEPRFPSSFRVPLHTLPAAELLTDSIGIAELILFEDGNNNDRVDLVSRGSSDNADTIVATSPVDDERIFVVFRETTERTSLLDTYGCAQPPRGYSVARIAHPSTCWIGDPSATSIPIRFDSSAAVRERICEAYTPPSTYPAQPPPPDTEIFCHARDGLEFVVDPGAFCPRVQPYQLYGCDQAVPCEQPEWDLRATPPDWWPCDGTHSGGFTLAAPNSSWSETRDYLFALDFEGDTAPFSPSQLVVLITLGSETAAVRTPDLILEDTNGDGLFGTGERLRVFEPGDGGLFGAQLPLTEFPVELAFESIRGDPNSAAGLAELLFMP